MGASAVEFKFVDTSEASDPLLREILDLYITAFGQWPARDPECPLVDQLRWKAESPTSELSFLVGRRDGRLVHASTIRSCRIQVGGRPLLALHFPDAAVHPSERGRGVYTQALAYISGPHRPPHDLALDELGVHPAMRRVNRRTGAQLPANAIRTMVRILNPADFAQKRDHKPEDSRLPVLELLTALASLQGLVASVGLRSAKPPGALTHIDRFGEHVDDFFRGVAGGFDLIVEKSREYLNWRYCDPRAGHFGVTVCERQGELLGYSVVRISDSKWDIADLLVLPGRRDVARALLTAAVAEARAGGAAAISCWLPRRHPYRSSLLRAGFSSSRRKSGFLYRPVDLPAEDLAFVGLKNAHLHLMIGDSDLV